SLLGWVRGTNAGALSVVVRYYASEGDRTFGEERVFTHGGGSFDWARFVGDLAMPADVAPSDPAGNPRALRIFLRQAPPRGGHALASWDDLAVVSWEEVLDLSEGAELSCPNARDFLRLSGVPGEVQLQLTFRRHMRFGLER
ncbi:MAG: hypothetical protein JRH20_09490, partial [Deltaproteobacteria bacterium]|nr:hypothetical protein [Deltaproteobacteria bacterium]